MFLILFNQNPFINLWAICYQVYIGRGVSEMDTPFFRTHSKFINTFQIKNRCNRTTFEIDN